MSRFWAFAIAGAVCVFARGFDSARADPESDALCTLFGNAARVLNQNPAGGSDALTKLENVDFSCADRTIIFHQRLVAPAAVLMPDWKRHMAQRWTSHYCAGGSIFAGAVLQHGWTIVTTVTTPEGTTNTILADCHAPEA